MKSKVWIWVLIAASLALVAVILFFPPSIPENLEFSDDPETLARGEYLVTAGGCISCHRGVENEEAFSGGLGLETDFGTFYVPNITPDTETGIGGWSAGEFARAMIGSERSSAAVLAARFAESIRHRVSPHKRPRPDYLSEPEARTFAYLVISEYRERGFLVEHIRDLATIRHLPGRIIRTRHETATGTAP